MVRVLFAVILGLSAAVAGAQTTAPGAEARARQLLAATPSGEEGSVACRDLDAAVASSLIDLGGQARATSLPEATSAFRLAERAARCAGAEQLIGSALNGLSDALYRRGDLDAALVAAIESLQINDRLNDAVGQALSWNSVANVRWAHGDMPGSLEALGRSLEYSTAAGDRRGEGRTLNNRGNVHRASGDTDGALEDQTRALQVFEDVGDPRSAAVVTNNIGITYFWRGEYAPALEFTRRALERQRAIGNQYGVGTSLDSVANVYRALGAYQLALQYFQDALRIRTALDDKPGVMETSHNIGLVYFSEGDYELAIDAYVRGLRLNRTLDDPWFTAEALRNIGAAAWRLGQRQRAAANFREALAIVHRLGSRPHEGELLHDLGEMALAEGRVEEASRLFDEALDVRRRIGDQAGVTETLTSLAAVRLAERRPAAALDLAQHAADNATTHDQPELRWRAQTLAGSAYRRMGRPDDARRALTAAIDGLDRLSTGVIGGENLRQRFLEDKLSPYHELVAIDVGRNAFGAALELAERSKARLLAALLGGAHDARADVLTAAERRTQGRLRGVLFSLNRQVDDERAKSVAGETRVTTLESNRRAAREALASFEASLVVAHHELAAARGQATPLTVADLGVAVPDRTSAVLEYVVAEDQLFAFVVTNDGTRVSIDGRAIDVRAADLAQRAERLRGQIATRDFGFAEEARALYTTLLAPVADRLAGRSRVVIVPDGPLWNVPFQALLGPSGYLVETTAVSYAPSITVLREIQTLPTLSGPPTLLAMAASPASSSSAPAADALGEAEAQVEALRDTYGADRSTIYSGRAATETQFKAAAPRYAVVHLAAHGVLDEASPLYSYLALSPDRDNPEDDGRLEAWEIARLKLNAEIVVLAACDTGRGRIAPGEGVIGTMWALFAAGARSMVVSQFAVESKSATTLLVAFHRHLATAPGSKAADLRAAAIELLHTPRYAHPYYWAGFILVGDSN